jgi:SH3 domain protein
MKRSVQWVLAIAIGLLGASAPGWADTVYVSDVIRISIRSGPGNDQKILTVIESGQPMEVLKAGEEWSFIQLPNGTEGYILSRFLTPQPPTRHRLEQLDEKHKALTAQAAALLEENARLKEENAKLNAEADAREKEILAVRAEFDDFRKGAGGYTALKAQYGDLAAELEQKKRTIAALEDQSANIFQLSYLYWFLAGAGVLFIGVLMGLSIKKRQRRYSSLS